MHLSDMICNVIKIHCSHQTEFLDLHQVVNKYKPKHFSATEVKDVAIISYSGTNMARARLSPGFSMRCLSDDERYPTSVPAAIERASKSKALVESLTRANVSRSFFSTHRDWINFKHHDFTG